MLFCDAFRIWNCMSSMTEWLGWKWTGMDLEGRGRGWRSCGDSHKSPGKISDVHTKIRTRYVPHTSVQCYRNTVRLGNLLRGLSMTVNNRRGKPPCTVSTSCSSRCLCDNLQCESHTPYGPPTSVTWLQLLRKRTNTDTSTVLTAETHWSTHTRLRALYRLVTSA